MATIPVNDITPRKEYVATAAQTVFPYDFWISEQEDLQVFQNGTLLTLTTHYTVSGVGNPAGGNVTLVSGATLNDVIIISRDIPIKRTAEFQQGGNFQASVLNAEQSKEIAILQQLNRDLDRKLGLSQTTTGTISTSLPSPSAGKAVIWNGTADGLTNSTDNFDSIVTNATAQATNAATSATNAATSEINAAASATAAATSATNAATSATNAATSAASVNIDTPVASKHGALVYQNDADDGFNLLTAQGTSGQILTSNGGDAAPSWQDAPAGMVPLSRQAISGSPSTVDFTSGISSTYNAYVFMFEEVTASTSPLKLRLRTSTNGGTSYATTAADYEWKYGRYSTFGTTGPSYTVHGSGTDTYIEIATNLEATGGYNGMLYMHMPSDAGARTMFFFRGASMEASTPDAYFVDGLGYRDATEAVDAVRFLLSSGTFSSGAISLYGITKP